jgi:RHS repeat-associated protein
MKRSNVFTKGFRFYPLFSVLLVIILLFTLFPNTVSDVWGQSDNTTSENITSSDNSTSDNTAPSDNTTIDIPLPSDNVTPDIPPPSDNVTTEELPQTDNITPDIPLPSDNITPEIPLPEKLSVLVEPDEDAEITSPENKIILHIPKGAVDKPTEIELIQHSPWSSTGMTMVTLLEFKARQVDNEKEISKFNRELELSIQHTPEELKGLDVHSLSLYYLDEESRQWLPVASSSFDQEKMVLTATLDHFSYYGEQANPLINGPGRVMAAQVCLNSGAATFSYPIELPPGPGGFQPNLGLTYNSATVDEMKNKRSMGSWVGIGWNLHLGRISHDSANEQYYLEINGASYELSSSDEENYYTRPDQYYKITRSENTWEMWDRDGIYYRFGGTTDSEQYHSDDIYYRWDLSLIEDTNGNQATINYVRDIVEIQNEESVRSAYPEYLKYNNDLIEVHFVSSWDEDDPEDGYLRYDNPKTYRSRRAPTVMENRRLDTIEIEVSDQLIRKYSLDYDTENRVWSPDYGGIYYSGNLTLKKITQVGDDGSTELPSIEFTYDGKQTYLYDSLNSEYNGNPGNPASFNWPHLVEVDSGYGGTITFTYTQIPDTAAEDIWTREVVTGKTISSGIGDAESYIYDYTGDPQYYRYRGGPWKAKYRGFNEVKETDAAGNYIRHYFYTTGNLSGMNTERLSGREYKTQWYDNVNTLLKEKTYDWSWETTHILPETDGNYVTHWTGWPTRWRDYSFEEPRSVAVSPDGYVYVTGVWSWDNYPSYQYTGVVKFHADGNYVTSWTDWSTTGGPNPNYSFEEPRSVAVSPDGYVYVAGVWSLVSYPLYQYTGVVKFDADGNYVTSWTDWSTGGPNSNYSFEESWSVTVSPDGYVYVTGVWSWDYYPLYEYTGVVKFDADGDYVTSWTEWSTGGTDYSFEECQSVAVSPDGYVYVAGIWSYYYYYYYEDAGVVKFDADGDYVTSWTEWSTGGTDYSFEEPRSVTVSPDGYVYVAGVWSYEYYYHYEDTGIVKFDDDGDYVTHWTDRSNDWGTYSISDPQSLTISPDGYIYLADIFSYDYSGIIKLTTEYSEMIYAVRLSETEETIYSETSDPEISRTRYGYDDYGNITTEYLDGDIDTSDDDATIHRLFYPNTDDNILSKPARERVYATIVIEDNGGAYLRAQTLYYYDGNNTSLTTPPEEGNLTRLQQFTDNSNSVSSYFTYDSYGNTQSSQDPEGNTTNWIYESTYNTYPETMTLPTNCSENYTYDAGTSNLLGVTDVNGWTTNYEYDTFKRLTKVIKPGDSSASPSIEHQYNNWGTLNQQHINIITNIDASNSLWQKDYFDGLGRVVQTQAQGETGYVVITSTVTYNNCGMIDKEYVAQVLNSANVSGYKAPDANWKYTSYDYDGLERVNTQTNADGTTISHDYSTAWQDLVTNARGYKTKYFYDAFQRLIKVEELNASHQLYATTEYTYDVLGNLTQVEDEDGNTTSMTYDWLSRKTAMTDPDMGSWSYDYDDNGNLTTQTDAKNQTIEMDYDALNRLVEKEYSSANMTDVSYTYDEGDNGNGQRTGMADSSGTTTYKYDARGRLIEEKRTIDSVDYVTRFDYDGADRVTWILYPTGENITQDYNGRGLPYSLSGSVVGDIVNSTVYNNLGQITEINLNNGLTNSFEYWGIDESGGYYGRLYRINVGNLMDVRHTWDAGGNLVQRQDYLASENENFTYDFLDRLTGVSGAYTSSFSYDEIGNIVSKNGVSYTYGTKPHAVTQVGSTSYSYDANGNMITRGSQGIDWDAENRPISVSDNGIVTTFVYDGDGNRVKKVVDDGQTAVTTIYVNRFYEVTGNEITSYYYLGGKLVAKRTGTELSYIHQEHLTGTALVTSDNGTSLGAMKYYPYGETRSGSVPTDKKFTGQRLDATGLYYYNARYYDPNIGRFISPDTFVQEYTNPQTWNRYSYVLNNPLRYKDPLGHFVVTTDSQLSQAWNVLKSVAPDMAKQLEGINKMVLITWNPVSDQGSACIGQGRMQVILMSPSLKDALQEWLVTKMAHESFHAIEGNLADSIQEEILAYQVEYEIGTSLGITDEDWGGSIAPRLHGLNPESESDRKEAKRKLSAVEGGPGFLYRNIPETSHSLYMMLGYMLGSAIANAAQSIVNSEPYCTNYNYAAYWNYSISCYSSASDRVTMPYNPYAR